MYLLLLNYELKQSFDSITTYKIKATETMVKVPVEEAKDILMTVEDAKNAEWLMWLMTVKTSDESNIDSLVTNDVGKCNTSK